ncbi:hypothetical protein D3C71_1896940 [compost metagenome]
MHQAHAIALHVKTGSGDDGTCASSYEKRSINALRLVKAPHPRANARAGAVGGPGQELAFVRLHPHGLAAVATALGNGRFKDPGVAAQERALFAGAKTEDFHAPDCAG